MKPLLPSDLDPIDDLAIAPRRPLVAVLPFACQQDDAALRILGTDAADLLRETLALTPELGAILISSDFLARAPAHALELICRQLRVGFLVSGKCYRSGPYFSVYIELADTRDWHVLWADFIKGHGRDLLVPGSTALDGVVAGVRRALLRNPVH